MAASVSRKLLMTALRIARIGAAYRLRLDAVDPGAPVPRSDDDVVVETVDFNEVKGLKVVASVPRRGLKVLRDDLDIAYPMLVDSAALSDADLLDCARCIVQSSRLEIGPRPVDALTRRSTTHAGRKSRLWRPCRC